MPVTHTYQLDIRIPGQPDRSVKVEGTIVPLELLAHLLAIKYHLMRVGCAIMLGDNELTLLLQGSRVRPLMAITQHEMDDTIATIEDLCEDYSEEGTECPDCGGNHELALRCLAIVNPSDISPVPNPRNTLTMMPEEPPKGYPGFLIRHSLN